MDNSQTLEMQIKAKSQDAIASVDKLISKLTGLEKTISSIDNTLKSNSVSKTVSNVNKLSNVTDKATNSTNKLSNALKNAFTFTGVKRITEQLLGWENEAIDYTEQLNLFNVVFDNTEKNGKKMFSELGKSAIQFQYKLNEAFGTNKTETLYMQGIFQSMGETVGIGDKYSAIMSETMTKLTYDLASLYNKSEDKVAEALRAGVYAGQTKPLRSYGIDVTQTSMQPILDSLGINEQVKNLSQAEKEILRYLATLKQARISMGDFANNLESPSNQMKIFKQQLVETKVALSSLFIGTFAKIMPYANAFLMVTKEISKAIATMFGIELTDYNTGIASQEGIYDGIADSADDASGAVKELKRQTLGFDEIHNINENNKSGSGASVSGGIDQRLLDAITGYDNGMNKVRMKATEIRDKWMEILGFTKEVDPLTGEISFKLTNTNTSMGKMITYIKDIIKYGKEAIVGVFKVIKDDFDNGTFGNVLVGVFKTIKDLLEFIAKHKSAQKTIAKLVEAFLLFKTVKAILSPVVTLYKNLINKVTTGAGMVETFVKQLKGQNNYIVDANGKLKQYNKTIEGHSNAVLNADGSINKWQTTLNKTKTSLEGLIASAIGIYTLSDSMRDVSKNGWDFSNSLGAITGGLSTIGGMATAGSVFGPIGTAIGTCAGVVTTLVTSLLSLKSAEADVDTQTQNLYDSIDKMSNEYKEMADARQKTIEQGTSEIQHYQDLLTELKNITDENGKIKQGYEDRAKIITGILSDALGIEITIIDGQIQKYDALKDSIQQVIEKKKAQIMLEAYEKDYAKAKKEQAGAEQLYGSAVENVKKIEAERTKVVKEVAKNYGISTKELMKALESGKSYMSFTGKLSEAVNYMNNTFSDSGKEYRKLTKDLDKAKEKLEKQEAAWRKIQNTIYVYEKAYGLVLNNNYEALNTFLTYESEVYGKNIEDTKKFYQNKIIANEEALNEIKNNREKYDDEEYQQLVEKYEDIISLSKEKLKELNMMTIKSVKDLTPEMIDSWGALAQSSEETFLSKFSLLPDDIQREVVDKMKEKGYSISSELQKGIDECGKPKIEIQTNKKDLSKGFYTVGQNIAKELSSGVNSKNLKFSFSDNGFRIGNSISFTSSITGYANGGFPEDGWFRASHGELMGRFDNGKSVVANNMQITQGIEEAAYRGYMRAIADSGINNGQSSEIDVHVHTDEGTIVDRINQRTKQTGVCPINMPVY